MTSELERLPRLIQQAMATLDKATTAAEILDATKQANVAYAAAKEMSKIRNAHDTVLEACRETMGHALRIETRAKCRLADEYDAAQARGEVNKQGGNRGNQYAKVPNENFAPTTEDIGLTRKQVHEARIVRDAEKAKPGVVEHIIEERLKAKKEPTRADIKRAVKEVSEPRKSKHELEERNNRIIALSDKGMSVRDIALEVGLVERNVNQILEHERIRRQAKAEPDIDRASLSMSAQEKLDAAIRQHKKALDREFERRVTAECHKRLDELAIPAWNKQIAEARAIYNRRRGILKNKQEFNLIRSCLHTDSRKSVSDKKLDEAFQLFTSLEKYMLDETQSPTEIGQGLPKTMAEWDRMRAAAAAQRRAKRTASGMKQHAQS